MARLPLSGGASCADPQRSLFPRTWGKLPINALREGRPREFFRPKRPLKGGEGHAEHGEGVPHVPQAPRSPRRTCAEASLLRPQNLLRGAGKVLQQGMLLSGGVHEQKVLLQRKGKAPQPGDAAEHAEAAVAHRCAAAEAQRRLQ